MEEYERACSIQGYHEYKVLTALLMAFATLAFSTAMFAGRLLGLADMLTTILQDLKDHSLASHIPRPNFSCVPCGLVEK